MLRSTGMGSAAHTQGPGRRRKELPAPNRGLGDLRVARLVRTALAAQDHVDLEERAAGVDTVRGELLVERLERPRRGGIAAVDVMVAVPRDASTLTAP